MDGDAFGRRRPVVVVVVVFVAVTRTAIVVRGRRTVRRTSR